MNICHARAIVMSSPCWDARGAMVISPRCASQLGLFCAPLRASFSRTSGEIVMPSFDIVSEVDLHQFTNAVDQAARVIETRFDFKGISASFERDKLTCTLTAEADFQID